MKCIYCETDTRKKDRTLLDQCPQCGKRFAFDPATGSKFTDLAFQRAIDAVSASGKVRWGVEHLYYELCRKKRFQERSLGCLGVGVFLILISVAGFLGDIPPLKVGAVLGVIALVIAFIRRSRQTVLLTKQEFDTMWARWQQVHGAPPSVIVRQSRPRSERAAEPDVEDYSFDRAVICDRARTVDLLLANNFHFENNCAVLAVSGYPAGPFEVVRKMLRRNPRLHVFAIHDASAEGCRLARRLAEDPEWFRGHAKVTDVGLRPAQTRPFRGLFLPATVPVSPGPGLELSEAEWLSSYTLELAAIRPEQVLKRLFRAVNRRQKSDDSGKIGRGDDSSDSWLELEVDIDSFGSDADASDGGADGFG